jgi:hypothetical protein
VEVAGICNGEIADSERGGVYSGAGNRGSMFEVRGNGEPGRVTGCGGGVVDMARGVG